MSVNKDTTEKEIHAFEVSLMQLFGFLMNDYDCYLNHGTAPTAGNPDQSNVLVIDLEHKENKQIKLELTIKCSKQERISVMKKLGIG